MKRPKKPAKLSMPKRPKQSAPLSVWENYRKNRSEVEKKNRTRESDWNAKIKKIETDKKKKASIINATK